jgi:hypothetical protein
MENRRKLAEVHKFAQFKDFQNGANDLRGKKKRSKSLFWGIFKIHIRLPPFKIMREQLLYM